MHPHLGRVGLAVAMESFGRSLKRLLDEREVQPAELARAVNVDRSYVSKWLRDVRTPRLTTSHIERIAAYLKLSDEERERLERAQVETLRSAAPKRAPAPKHDPGRPVAKERLGSSAPTDTLAGRIANWPEQARIIRGLPALHAAVLEVLEGLDAPATDDDTITFTLHATASAEASTPAILKRYPAAIRRALGLGWQVRELWRLDDDARRTATLAAHLLDLVGAGRYEPHYYTRYGTHGLPYELIVVPGRASFQLIATESIRAVDSAILATDGAGMAALRDHAEVLARQTAPVFERYPIASRAAFAEVLAATEALPGGRRMVKHGLTVYTEPEGWSRRDSHWARRMARMGADVDALIAVRKRRLEAFRRNVRLFPYRDICPVSALQQMVEQGAYMRDDAPEGYDPADRATRGEHLRSAIESLETCDNYSLALVDDHEAARFGIRPDSYWAVVGETRAMLNIRAPDASGRLVDADVDVTEPTIAAGFARHFDAIWERIAPRHRDKAHVIGWLRQQLAQLDAQ